MCLLHALTIHCEYVSADLLARLPEHPRSQGSSAGWPRREDRRGGQCDALRSAANPSRPTRYGAARANTPGVLIVLARSGSGCIYIKMHLLYVLTIHCEYVSKSRRAASYVMSADCRLGLALPSCRSTIAFRAAGMALTCASCRARILAMCCHINIDIRIEPRRDQRDMAPHYIRPSLATRVLIVLAQIGRYGCMLTLPGHLSSKWLARRMHMGDPRGGKCRGSLCGWQPVATCVDPGCLGHWRWGRSPGESVQL